MSHGQGEYVYENKNVFKGYWEFGEIKGKGELFSPNGTKLDGKQEKGTKKGKWGAKIKTKGEDRKYIGQTDLNGNNGKLNFNEPEVIDDAEKRRMKEM